MSKYLILCVRKHFVCVRTHFNTIFFFYKILIYILAEY